MKVLVVGLGSMGKRRIRCLQELGIERIVGTDIRLERRAEVESILGVRTAPSMLEVLNEAPDVAMICTPPDLHLIQALTAAMEGVPVFTEADIFPMEVPNGYPSCTMRYFAGPRKVKELVESGAVGRPLSFVYHVGQWLPDWHPHEDYRKFYVSKRETGACREIVPFELCWLTWLFGDVTSVMAYKGKLSDLDADIDDTYQLLLEFGSGVHGVLQVDVVARPGLRNFNLIGSESSLFWNDNESTVEVYRNEEYGWDSYSPGYDKESFYVEETRDFLLAVQGKKLWSYSYHDERKVLQVLMAAERSHEEGKRIRLEY